MAGLRFPSVHLGSSVRGRLIGALAIVAALVGAERADSRVLGTFRWRTEPYCNVLTTTVTQVGAAYTLDGFEEQCGGNPRQVVHGIAVPQADGTITLGLSVVANDGSLLLPRPPIPVNLQANINLATLSGFWRDSGGSSGAFTYNPAGTAGEPRPLAQALGAHSLAAGFNTVAQGDMSQALGYFTSATAVASTAIGSHSQALGPYSFAGGSRAACRP